MGLMDKMAKSMISKMSQEQREEMMLNMMPDMLDGINIVDMMSKMMPDMAKSITLLDLIRIIRQGIPQLLDTFKKLKDQMPAAMEKAPLMMEMMIEIMPEIMSKMMPIMFEHMDLDKMAEKKDVMMRKMLEKEPLDQLVPQMQSIMIPGCLRNILPKISVEKRQMFISEMQGIFNGEFGEPN